MGWPGPIDYNEALQHPDRAFSSPDLQRARVELNRRGLPAVRAGGFALVYKLRRGASATAARVFLYPSEEREERYRIILGHLARVRPRSLVDFGYQPRGIRIGRDWYPVQTMPWVEGSTLGSWANDVASRGEVARLRRMAERWVELIGQLRQARIAHGDLQHGNVLVVADDVPVLVDYDGMVVPGLVGRPSLEVGLPAYQHPERRGQHLSLTLDDFSAWVIFIALRAVAADPVLWRKYVVEPDNENLLFAESDIASPGTSRLWAALAASPDRHVRAWSAQLRASLAEPFDRIPSFQPDAPAPRPVVAPAPTRRQPPTPAVSPTGAGALLDRLRRIPSAATLTNDLAFRTLWQQQTGAPNGPAEFRALQGRGAEVLARLQRRERLFAAIRAADQGRGSEQAILDAAGALPPGYDAALQPRIDQARTRSNALPPAPRENQATTRRLESLLDAVSAGRAEDFLARVDLATLRGNLERFRPHRRVVEGWVRAHVLHDRPIRPTVEPPLVRDSRLTIRATWAKPHLIDHVRVIARDVDRESEGAVAVPGAGRVLTVDQFRREGGIVVPIAPGVRQIAVMVWPEVDLGWTEILGAPLRLGPFAVPRRGPDPTPAPRNRQQ